jgi:sporulation protein YlmC with PRC-barrel domain
MPMLLPLERIVKTPVMSLQTGAQLAVVDRILIGPRDLLVVAYVLDGPSLVEHPSFLRPTDVRELSNLGFIVDSSDEFVGLDDVIKIQQVYEFEFELLHKPVIDDKRHRLGKVQSYNLDSASFSVQQLVVKRPLLKSINESELLIDRQQVLEISDERILVRSSAMHSPIRQSLKEYANPFRSSTQPESIES